MVPVKRQWSDIAHRLASRSSIIAQYSGLLKAKDNTALSPCPKSHEATWGAMGILSTLFSQSAERNSGPENFSFPLARISWQTSFGTAISLNKVGRRSISPLLSKQIRGEALTMT